MIKLMTAYRKSQHKQKEITMKITEMFNTTFITVCFMDFSYDQ